MKRIALAIETSLASGREIVLGISRFLDTCDDWSIFQLSGQLGVMDLEAIQKWDGDGIIARIANPKIHDLIKAKNLPTVDVLGNIAPYSFPVVTCDDEHIGATAAEHFIKNGVQNLVYVGVENELWSASREQGFFREANNRGAKSFTCNLQQAQPDYGSVQKSVAAIEATIRETPMPMGVMVASDQYGPLVFEACRNLSLFIPDQVSVIGVDNDAPYCNLCRPRLSSIAPNHQRVGYLAANILDDMLRGIEPQQQVYKIAPHTIHARLSSDSLSVTDPQIVKAMQYIREKAHTGISLDDVATIAGLSRSSLQRRVRELMNRSVGELIISEKIRIAADLLTYSDLSLTAIAERSGFKSQEYLNQIFRKHLDTTPRKFQLSHKNAD